MSPSFYLLALLFLIDLLISATRAGLLNARHERLTTLGEEEGRPVERALELIAQRATLRDSLRLLQTLLRFAVGALAVALFLPATQQSRSLLIILLVTALVVWLGEFFIEGRVRRNPETWALRFSPLAWALRMLVAPILALPQALSRQANGDGEEQLVTITEQELKSLVNTGQREGLLERDESKMIFSIFQFGDTLAREIMVPRIDMFSLEINTPLKEAAEAVLESGYSRVPVYADNIDNIQGLLYTKDMLKVWQEGSQYQSLRELLRPANYIPESKKVDELLAEMQDQRIHIAIVADEYGGVAGLVTLEDIVEEIVGEIRDEYDQSEEALYHKVSDTEYVFHGRIDMDDFNELMGVALSTEEADTLGGYIYSRVGRVPRAGESLQEEGLLLTVEQITARRIRKVRAQRVDIMETEDEENGKAN